MDYGFEGKRRTKKDLSKKRRYRVYKIGGKHRVENLEIKKGEKK